MLSLFVVNPSRVNLRVGGATADSPRDWWIGPRFGSDRRSSSPGSLTGAAGHLSPERRLPHPRPPQVRCGPRGGRGPGGVAPALSARRSSAALGRCSGNQSAGRGAVVSLFDLFPVFLLRFQLAVNIPSCPALKRNNAALLI